LLWSLAYLAVRNLFALVWLPARPRLPPAHTCSSPDLSLVGGHSGRTISRPSHAPSLREDGGHPLVVTGGGPAGLVLVGEP
jgi:hypothetical protein